MKLLRVGAMIGLVVSIPVMALGANALLGSDPVAPPVEQPAVTAPDTTVPDTTAPPTTTTTTVVVIETPAPPDTTPPVVAPIVPQQPASITAGVDDPNSLPAATRITLPGVPAYCQAPSPYGQHRPGEGIPGCPQP